MLKERIERYTQGLATTCDAERIERNDEIRRRITFETTGHHCKYCENEAADDLEWCCDGDVGEEEGLDTINTILVIAIEHIPLDGVHSDIV